MNNELEHFIILVLVVCCFWQYKLMMYWKEVGKYYKEQSEHDFKRYMDLLKRKEDEPEDA